MLETKVFQSGNSQAIRLPKEYRIDSTTVILNRVGNAIIITPKDDPWRNFSEGIEDAVDFPENEGHRLHTKDIEL